MRPNYQAGALLGARDLNDEQEYLLNHLRRHDRFAHGSGIVCGLRVFAAPAKGRPWGVRVCPGYAVDPCGNEIEVPVSAIVDIRQFLHGRPVTGGVASRAAFVGLRYAAAGGGAESQSSGGCSCGCTEKDSHGAANRLADGYAIEIVWTLPKAGPDFDLCTGAPAPCPPPITTPYVILAAVRLPVSQNTPLTDSDILSV